MQDSLPEFVVELLARMICKNNKIEGLNVNGNVCKLNQYADDTFLSTLNKDDCVREIFKLINEFSVISGLTLNMEKTEVLYIGKIVCSNLIDKSWLKEEVNPLGVKIGVNPS